MKNSNINHYTKNHDSIQTSMPVIIYMSSIIHNQLGEEKCDNQVSFPIKYIDNKHVIDNGRLP